MTIKKENIVLTNGVYGVMDRVDNRTPKIIVCRYAKSADVNTHVKFGNVLEKAVMLKANISDNSWIVSTDKTCEELRDIIDSSLENVDAIFVGEITDEIASKNVYSLGDFKK